MTAAGEMQVVDIRKYTRDSDGEMPRLLELGSSRFGTVEQIDDYHFRYSAPSEGGLDVFLYRIADGTGTKNENWVLAKVADGPNRPATLHTALNTSDHSVRESAEPKTPSSRHWQGPL